MNAGLSRDPLAAILRVTIVGAAFILLLWALSDVVLMIFLAVLIAVLLRGAADWVAHRTKIPVGLALAIVAVGLAVLLIGFVVWIGPNLMHQARDLISNLSHRIDTLKADYGNTQIGQFLFGHLSNLGGKGGGSLLAGSAATAVWSTFGTLGALFLIIVIALYLAISPTLYVNGVVRLVPMTYRGRARTVLARMGHDLSWWFIGQLVDMVAVGVLSGIGLAVLGIPLALALGVLAGLLTFIPYFGAIIAAVPGFLVGLTVSWTDAIWVLVIFTFCHGIEGYIIAPLVQRRTVHLAPALTILSMTIMGAIFGVLGVVLGTPIAVVILVATQELYVGDVLGDRELESGVGS